MTSRQKELEKTLREWRQSQELSLLCTGMSLTAIAEKLQVNVSTVSKDIKKMRQEAREKHGEYIDNLPFEHTLSVASINKAHDELWTLFRQTQDAKLKKSILDSIGEIVVKRQILLGDPEHIDRALRAVARIRKQIEVEEQEQEQEVKQE